MGRKTVIYEKNIDNSDAAHKTVNIATLWYFMFLYSFIKFETLIRRHLHLSQTCQYILGFIRLIFLWSCFLINSLGPSDAYMRQWTNHDWYRWLVAWAAPSHYLNQCWHVVNWTIRNKLQWIFNYNTCIYIEENTLENVVWEMAAILSRPQCVKKLKFA